MTFRTIAEQLREQAKQAMSTSRIKLLNLQQESRKIREQVEQHQEIMANANRAVLAAEALEKLEDEADGGGV